MRSGVQIRVVELDLVGEDVVDVRRDSEIPLPDVLADSRPGDTGEMQERDTPVPQVMGRERRHPCGTAGAARAIRLRQFVVAALSSAVGWRRPRRMNCSC